MSSFKCNIEISKDNMIDNKLTKALEMLSVNSEYIIEFTNSELAYIIYKYMKDVVDVDMYESNMAIDVTLSYLTINEENEDEKVAIINQIVDHFGASVFNCSSVKQIDLNIEKYSINLQAIYKKIFKYALVRKATEWTSDVEVVYDEVMHFTNNAWLFDYIKNEEE